jgi:hypothetical protein
MAAHLEGAEMRRTSLMRSAAPVAAAVTALLLVSACGDVKVTSDSSKDDGGSASASSDAPKPDVDTSVAEGNWLLGVQTAGGNDAEKSTTVYITYDPSTGQATSRTMPGVTASSASSDLAALLVSSDRKWAIPDTEISDGEEHSGQLKVYSLTSDATRIVDIRSATGHNDLKAIGWAFDPERADTLRVVDTANRVWDVNVAGGKATQEGTLAKGPWVFTNGFNHNTGKPYMESIESDATNPAGNGPADTSPVTRDGGTILANDSDLLAKLPASPCRLGAGFTDANGVTWVFCADKPTVSTYYLPKDEKDWTAYGKPSTPVAPDAAAFPLVLPPAG